MPIIQWFPGHMAKAKREIKEKLSLVDVVIELRDARIPLSSKNPMVDEIVGDKPRLIILNKALIADKTETKKWIDFLTKENVMTLDVDCLTNYNIKNVIPYIKEVLKEKINNDLKRGKSNTLIRALIIGIPNVGKSTFINTLSQRKAAKTGDKPGVTKAQTWIKITDELQILDTPGILWPKFEDQEVGVKLSICGSIKDEIVDLGHVSFEALKYMIELYPQLLCDRYNLDIDEIKDLEAIDICDMIARKRGCLIKGGEIDYDRVFTLIINDIRNNRIGAMTFERANS
ncbi:MAG: ribosome biogenesis GTPase YlqF [Anaeroplasmataceae bacterium]